MKCDCDYLISDDKDLPGHYDNCSPVWIEKHPGKICPKNKDGTIRLPNPHLQSLSMDILYHLGLDTQNYDLPAMFGDVKFLCIGGTKYRMREFAGYMAESLGLPTPEPKLVNLTKHSQRYAMYKVGPVLSVSHGIGIPSMTTLLLEAIKLLYYAKAKNPVVIRIGTCGGVAVPPGSVVVSTWGLSGILQKTYDLPVLGQIRKLPALYDGRLSREIHSLASRSDDPFTTYLGGTMAADDFYMGQGRLDGPFCDYSDRDQTEYLMKLRELGVMNIEMESTAFAAITSEAGLRASAVCVAFVNRLEGDQVTPSKAVLNAWQKHPMIVVGRYISKCLQNNTNK